MRRLSLIILLLPFSLFAQSPHGKTFTIECDQCHSSSDWSINPEKIKFDHSKTQFELSGQHTSVQCKSCHTSLKFDKTEMNCFSCHTDVHENSVGAQCEECHNTNSWIVNNIKEIHELQRFPLLGVHLTSSCNDCHKSSSQLNFIPLGVNCVDCHLKDYQSTTSPNHVAGGYSTECEDCHSFVSNGWTSTSITHTFFPLVEGHNIGDCFACHNQNTYSGLSQQCFSCHESDYKNTQVINHQNLDIPTDCEMCHTLSPGWEPASFPLHDNFFELTGAHSDIRNNCIACHSNGFANTSSECFSCHNSDFNATQNPPHTSAGFSTDCTECHNTQAWVPSTFDHDTQYFPIYSGEHRGAWSSCNDCHTTPNNFLVFSCTNCHAHNQSEMNSEHSGISGYNYNSISCYGCHPTGREGGSFNHSQTQFPLLGVHSVTLCSDCHTANNVGLSMECYNCHQDDYNSSVNPSHTTLGLPTTCDECHTSDPNWQPALFPQHSSYFELTGAHLNISNDCSLCHQGNYTSTLSECSSCHMNEYNATVNPSHTTAGFSTECSACHSTTSWIPAEFDHDSQFFPIFSGTHNSAWDNCNQCHIENSSYAVFSCITCHEHNQAETDLEHTAIPGYLYSAAACYDCHPTGSGQGFNHNQTNFALIGAHTQVSCSDCHTAGYSGTSAECYSCHSNDYSTSTNPSHQSLNLSTGCEECHTTQPGWEPASFAIHNQYFPLTGAHQQIADNCQDCHKGNYVNNSTLCYDCHIDDYNSAQYPNHKNLNIPTECRECHLSDTDWKPAAFIIHNQFYELLGAHELISNDCSQCHNSTFTDNKNTCYACHADKYNSTTNPPHNPGFSTDCEQCHGQNAWTPSSFNHDQFYLLQGAHAQIASNCSACHNSTFTNNKSTCYECHSDNYNSTTSPPHNPTFATTCETCHSQTAWKPATFNHDQFYVLQGAHAQIANNCSACHNSTFTNNKSTCYECHSNEYNSVTNPQHNPTFATTCEDCHSQSAWKPSTFDHDAQYFPIYSGKHRGEWNLCSECHTTGTYSTFSCIDCHEHNNQTSLNGEHNGVSNYVYSPTSCYGCHPNGKEDGNNLF